MSKSAPHGQVPTARGFSWNDKGWNCVAVDVSLNPMFVLCNGDSPIYYKAHRPKTLNYLEFVWRALTRRGGELPAF